MQNVTTNQYGLGS